jgi:multidrug efflux pump subunit AcrA (membrane-fusion protein)
MLTGNCCPACTAEIKFMLPHDGRTLLIPGSALLVRSDGPKVLIVDAKQTIRTGAVKLGRDLGEQVEILSGLGSNESLVANPTDQLREGVEVKAQAQPAQAGK